MQYYSLHNSGVCDRWLCYLINLEFATWFVCWVQEFIGKSLTWLTFVLIRFICLNQPMESQSSFVIAAFPFKRLNWFSVSSLMEQGGSINWLNQSSVIGD